MEKIKAFIVNRNLITTLKNTVEFLQKEPRIEIVILDQASTYPPLLDYYKTLDLSIIYFPTNGGPYAVWTDNFKSNLNDNPYIVTDPDCVYDDVPLDWLNKMINVLDNSPIFKVGFSLNIDDIPDTGAKISSRGQLYTAKEWESRFWTEKNEFGWVSEIDTTFALYRPISESSLFSYNAIRLDKPYSIKHMPWYLTKENLTPEWSYYLNEISEVSYWGSALKNINHV